MTVVDPWICVYQPFNVYRRGCVDIVVHAAPGWPNVHPADECYFAISTCAADRVGALVSELRNGTQTVTNAPTIATAEKT